MEVSCGIKVKDCKGFEIAADISGTLQPADGIITTRLPKLGADIGKDYKGVTYKVLGEGFLILTLDAQKTYGFDFESHLWHLTFVPQWKPVISLTGLYHGGDSDKSPKGGGWMMKMKIKLSLIKPNKDIISLGDFHHSFNQRSLCFCTPLCLHDAIENN
jgi:hypothetical protein